MVLADRRFGPFHASCIKAYKGASTQRVVRSSSVIVPLFCGQRLA